MDHRVLQYGPMSVETATPTGVRVLHKTLDILEAIKQTPSGLRLADLHRSVELPKATVYRILNTLETRGYLDRDKLGHYRMARKLFDLQRSAPIEQILGQVAQPLMAELTAECKETVNLGIIDAGEIVVIQTIESPQAVRMTSKVGNRRYLHATALGKVMLAGMPDKEILRLVRLKGLPAITENTICTKAELLAEIQKVRKQGYSIDNQENEMEGRCIGAPITGSDGRLIGALSISGPVFRMDMARARAWAPRLKAVCAAISRAVAEA
jgi:DNA-binding IclR family transcriptional regulator